MYTINNDTKHLLLSLKCFPTKEIRCLPKLTLEDAFQLAQHLHQNVDTLGDVPQARDMAVNTIQKEGSQEHTPALTGRLEMAVLVA